MTQQIAVQTVTCPHCQGKGCEWCFFTGNVICRTCTGSGYGFIGIQWEAPEGDYVPRNESDADLSICPDCGGSGFLPADNIAQEN